MPPTPVAVQPPAPEIGRYGELDPFGGGISCHREELPRLVRELKLFLLLKDVAILAPNELLEHTLTLPACEALAPFVRAGRLTTTAEPALTRPMALIEQQARRHLDGLPDSSRQNLVRARHGEISAIIDRWDALLPSTWTLHRDVPAQIAGFISAILDILERTPELTPAAIALRDFLAERRAAGRSLDRHTVLAHVAALRSTAPPRELARLSFIVQSMYFEAGAAAHTACTLHPGAFARLSRRPGVAPAELQPLPVDWDAAPSKVERRLLRLGVDPERLLALPIHALFELATSPEWLTVRPLLRGRPASPEVERAVAALFGHHADPTDALALLSPTLGSPAPRLPSPWQLAVSATLRIAGLATAPIPAPHVTLDLCTLTLCGPDHGPKPIPLARAYLLTVLAAAGATGLSIFDLEQLSFDCDRVCGARDVRVGPWRAQSREPAARASARVGRVRVLVSRVNETLAPFDLRVAPLGPCGSGRHAIIDLRNSGRHLCLRGTLWNLLGTTEPPVAPPGLSLLHARSWRALAEVTPQSLTLDQLAAVLDKPCDERGLKQVIDTITRFGRRLVALGVPWRVIRAQRGAYALLPLRAAVRSEVP